MGDLRKEILRKTAGMPPPQFQFKAPQKAGQEAPVYEPLEWDQFFDEQRRTDDGFLVYLGRPPVDKEAENASLKPYVFLLHGAGYTALSWSLVTVRRFTPFYKCDTFSSFAFDIPNLNRYMFLTDFCFAVSVERAKTAFKCGRVRFARPRRHQDGGWR